MSSLAKLSLGFFVAIAVHATGAVLATMFFLGDRPEPTRTDAPPQLAGQTTEVRFNGEAVAWQPEPLPPSPEYTPPEIEVRPVSRPMEVHRRALPPVPPDAPRIAPAELAMAQRITRAPTLRTEPREEPVPREADASPSQSQPRREPHVRVPSVRASLPASTPQDQSVGHNAETLPSVLENRPPVYPPQAMAAGWQGTVLMRVHVASSGDVAKVEVLSSSGHSLLDTEAVRAVRTWRFRPATSQGRPAASAVRLPVRFTLH